MVEAAPLVRLLVDLGATHLVGIPDNATARLYECAGEEPAMRVVTVTREGEARVSACCRSS